MTHTPAKHRRVLGIAPSTRGFGFALFDGEVLHDWGVKSVKGEKNKESLGKIEKLIIEYRPDILAIEDYVARGSRRAPRIRSLGEALVVLAKQSGIKLSKLKRRKVRRTFFNDRDGTKQELAEILANRFPETLLSRLPKKRRVWDSEPYQMGVFDAIAIALSVQPSGIGDR